MKAHIHKLSLADAIRPNSFCIIIDGQKIDHLRTDSIRGSFLRGYKAVTTAGRPVKSNWDGRKIGHWQSA